MQGSVIQSFESVAVSTRIRLARNFREYPFPNLLIKSPHAEEMSEEMVSILCAELDPIDDFVLYHIKDLSDDDAAFLKERNLVSRDLILNRRISAALVSEDESISVMINEEDHVREQYFMKGFDLEKAYERVAGIDDVISECIPFAFDEQFGYLTACPTNLGTGLRASVMLFLPAVSRRGLMRRISSDLARGGLTVRGAFGEGSGNEGDLFQISNEMTLGHSEEVILRQVDQAVSTMVELEIRERERMKAEGGVALRDKVRRALGVLLNCCTVGEDEFKLKIADVKLGLALGILGSVKGGERSMSELDDLLTAMRPANINRLCGETLPREEQDMYRAENVVRALGEMKLYY